MEALKGRLLARFPSLPISLSRLAEFVSEGTKERRVERCSQKTFGTPSKRLLSESLVGSWQVEVRVPSTEILLTH